MGWFWDHHTETAATVITEIAPPSDNNKARLNTLVYTPGTTAHDLIIMRAIAEVELTANAAAAATVVNVSSTTFGADTVAANDWLIIEHGDGSFGIYKVSSVASLAVTLTAGLTKDVVSGGRVWIMGAPGDSAFHSTLKARESTRETLTDLGIESDYDTGAYSSDGLGQPLMLYTDNVTVAGTLNYGSGTYVGI